jgi:hypothetical protein
MNRVFVDMDGVIVDFDRYMRETGLTPREIKDKPGAYLDMPAIPGAIEAVRTMIGWGLEVWIATKPPTGIPFAYADKAAWIMREIPELTNRIIITHDKGLLGDSSDWLIDDRPHRANASLFAGRLLRYREQLQWPDILVLLREAMRATEARLPAEFVTQGVQLAKGARLYGKPLMDMTRDELLATAAEGWKVAQKRQERSILG